MWHEGNVILLADVKAWAGRQTTRCVLAVHAPDKANALGRYNTDLLQRAVHIRGPATPAHQDQPAGGTIRVVDAVVWVVAHGLHAIPGSAIDPGHLQRNRARKGRQINTRILGRRTATFPLSLFLTAPRVV